MTSAESETPDAIGWRVGRSILIECKTSRSDFLADGKKFFRQYPEQGMGHTRYFMAPAGLIKPDDLPAGWGLLEVGVKIRETVKPADHRPYDASAEVTLLLSVIRRGVKDPMVSCRYYTIDDGKRRATLTTGSENGTLSEIESGALETAGSQVES
jgi:hypothetical protein